MSDSDTDDKPASKNKYSGELGIPFLKFQDTADVACQKVHRKRLVGTVSPSPREQLDKVCNLTEPRKEARNVLERGIAAQEYEVEESLKGRFPRAAYAPEIYKMVSKANNNNEHVIRRFR